MGGAEKLPVFKETGLTLKREIVWKIPQRQAVFHMDVRDTPEWE